jgi:hypothetical protein
VEGDACLAIDFDAAGAVDRLADPSLRDVIFYGACNELEYEGTEARSPALHSLLDLRQNLCGSNFSANGANDTSLAHAQRRPRFVAENQSGQ